MTDPSEQLGSFFFTVKYGKNQSRIFNANCRNEILLENIRNQCKCSNNDTIELSDERGRVKNIRNNKDDYGIKFIKERENVILLKVEATAGNNSKEKPKYIPLLQELQENAAFIDAVNLGKTTGDDPLFRRRSSTTTPDQNELSSSRGSSKSKSSSSSKKKGVGRRQSSRLLVKNK